MIHETICKTFCDRLRVRTIRNGYAISAPFENFIGEELAFYALVDAKSEGFRLFDNGTLIPHLEAAGATLDNSTRFTALQQMLQEHGARLDENRRELFRLSPSEDDLPNACLDFMVLLLRIKDLLLMTHERAESTFKEDVRTHQWP